MYVQLVTFTLNGVTEEQYRQSCSDETAVFATMSGLLSKVWLRDADTGTYGGLYLWQDRAAYENYLTSEVFAAIKDDPALVDVSSRGFDHFEELTAETQPGLVLTGR